MREARRAMARLPSLRMGRIPDATALSVRDPWPGDPTRGAQLIKGEIEIGGFADGSGFGDLSCCKRHSREALDGVEVRGYRDSSG